MNTPSPLIVLAALTPALALRPASAQVSSRVIAATGQASPVANFVYSDNSLFGLPVLNDDGVLVFSAPLENMTTQSSALLRFAGSLQVLSRPGETPPGVTDGRVFRGIDLYQLTADGSVLVRGLIGPATGLPPVQDGYWRLGGADRLIALEEAAAPGAPAGTTFSDIGALVANDAGDMAFIATLTGPSVTSANNRAIYRFTNETLELVVRTSDAAPGLAGVSFSVLDGFALGDGGHIAFLADLTGSGVFSLNDESVWVTRNGQLTLVAREGSAAPGLSMTESYGGQPNVFSLPSVNRSGDVAFGSGINTGFSARNQGLWAESAGALQLVVREGDPAPGLPAGDLFFELLPDNNNRDPLLINDQGQIAFRSRAGSNGDYGIWTGRAGQLRLGWIEGGAIPEIGTDVTFAPVLFNYSFNNNGRLAYVGRAQGGGVTTANDDTLFVEGPGGRQLALRSGGNVGGPTVLGIGLDTSSDITNGRPRPNGFNDRGQAAVRVDYPSPGFNGAIVLLTPVRPGDTDEDVDADSRDLATTLSNLGRSGGLTRSNGDFNADGAVDQADLTTLLAGFSAAL